MSAPLDPDDGGPYTLVVERPVPSKLWFIPAVCLVLSALIGSFGLVSYAKDANARAEAAEDAVSAARTQLGDQTVELRCRGRASADVAAAEGQLLVAIADALVVLGEGTRPRQLSVADIAQSSRALAEAIRAQQAAQTECKE
jgi:hypothetical protein